MSSQALFDSQVLRPDEWPFPPSAPLYCFNPGLVPVADGWAMAYRLVGPDGMRHMAMCRLDAAFQFVAGSVRWISRQIRFRPDHSFSDHVLQWFADPRLVRLAGRLFIQWNSGWHDPINHQFIQELDPQTFAVLGYARELRLVGERRKIEKNWMLFGGDPGFAVYSINPHRVLAFSLAGEGDVDCLEVANIPWQDRYALNYGQLRGGTPPWQVGDHLVSFCHSVFGQPGEYEYVAAAYSFSSSFPFAPRTVPHRPLSLIGAARPVRHLPRLNPAVGRVIYPTGACCDSGRWVISFGIDDEHCAIASVMMDQVAEASVPVALLS